MSSKLFLSSVCCIGLISYLALSSGVYSQSGDALADSALSDDALALRHATTQVASQEFASIMAASQENCPSGYVLSGAIAMHGQPDIKKTNEQLCKLFLLKKQQKQPPHLSLAEKGQFSGLNYLIPKGEVSYSVRPWVMDTLMFRSPFEPFTMYPLIASVDEVADDRSYVVFKISPEAKFNNGQPIHAKDVLFSFKKLREKGLYNFQIAYKNVSAKILDSDRIRFDFVDKNPEQPLLLGLMPVFSSQTTDEEFDTQDLSPPVMAGAYIFKKAELGKSITLERNPNYWGWHTPQGQARFHFETVKFDFYRNDTAAFETLKAGQSDFFYEDNLKRLFTAYDFPAMKRGDYILNKVPTGRPSGLYAFTMNTRNRFLLDRNLRKAINLAFNFDAINKYYLFGQFKQVKSIFDQSELAYHRNGHTIKAISQDYRERLEVAHRLLKNKGYRFKGGLLYTSKDEQVVLKVLLNNPVDEKFAGSLKKDLEKIGIALVVQTVDDTIYQSHLTKFDYDMIAYQWYNSLSPGIEQKNYWHCSTRDQHGSRNYVGICNPKIDQAISDLLAAKTRADLMTASGKLDYYLMRNYYFIPLYGQSHYNIIARKNIIPSVGGATYFSVIEQKDH